MPTAPCIAPTIAEVDASDEDYFRWNMRILRNVGVVNFLDGCAVTLPCHGGGRGARGPVGLRPGAVGPARPRGRRGRWKASSRTVPEPAVVDARLARRRFERAAASYAGASRLEAEIGARMLERLDYVKLAPRRVLDAGSGPGRDARAAGEALSAGAGASPWISLGACCAPAPRLRCLACGGNQKHSCAPISRACPSRARRVDLVWSNMALHWAADPLAALREFHRVLAVEGLLMFSTLGPDTLAELRAAAGAARVHAFADMHDLGDMLVAAGFAEPVMDMERLTMVYADGEALLADLRASGQTSARADRARGLAGRGFLAALHAGLAAQLRDGKLPVSYEVVYGHAWKAGAAAAPRTAARSCSSRAAAESRESRGICSYFCLSGGARLW